MVPLTCTDTNGDAITLAIATPPTFGTLGRVDQANDRVLYTPDPTRKGRDTFRYRATARGLSKSGGPRDAQRRRGAREVRPEAAQHANHLGTCEDDEVPHRALQVQVDGTRLGLPVQARLAEALDELPLTEELREPEARQALVPGARDRQGRERRPDAGQEAGS